MRRTYRPSLECLAARIAPAVWVPAPVDQPPTSPTYEPPPYVTPAAPPFRVTAAMNDD
jgi:hypothetical protein